MRSLRYYKRCGREERQLREQIVLTPMRNVPVIHANVVRKFQLKVALGHPGENSSPTCSQRRRRSQIPAQGCALATLGNETPKFRNANGVREFQPRVALWQPLGKHQPAFSKRQRRSQVPAQVCALATLGNETPRFRNADGVGKDAHAKRQLFQSWNIIVEDGSQG